MNKRICVFGEVLFDHFPDGQQVLGGAPFNVARHLQAFGLAPHFISRVGNDDEGRQVHQAMLDWGMDTSGLQFDRRQPTGRVEVRFDSGEPHYDIVAPVAWDRIVVPDPLPDCDLLYHGSLALRDPVSRRTAEALLANPACEVFVDVNLRAPWWRLDDVLATVARADWVKLNQDELNLLQADDGDRAMQFLERHALLGLVVTRGADGAELLLRGGERLQVSPGGATEVVDTVGAGDAFASVLLLGLARGWPLQTVLQRAQEFASRIVGVRGASVADADFYRPFIEHWQD